MFFGIFAGTTRGELDGESVQAAHRYSVSGAGVGMIVWERGRVRFEDYYNGHSAGKAVHIYSGTKSFFGVLAAMAQEEGLLDLDELVSETIPEWRDDSRKREILIRDLLDFTSGLDAGAREIYGGGPADKLTLSLGLRAGRSRGSAFVYGPSHLQVFCEVLRRKLKGRGISYGEYLKEKLVRPLGISITRWKEDDHGNPFPSAGMYMTGRDWLKFGQLMVQGGHWGERQLVRTDTLRRGLVGTRINPAYGMCFWLNANAGRFGSRVVDVEEWLDREPMPENWKRACLSQTVPRDMMVALGSNYQRLYIVPSLGLVVVHLGKKEGEFRDEVFLDLLFRNSAPE